MLKKVENLISFLHSSQVVVGEIDSDLISKYTVLAASYCLMRYIENITDSMFPSFSLRQKTRSCRSKFSIESFMDLEERIE